jgi:hypothetical protein
MKSRLFLASLVAALVALVGPAYGTEQPPTESNAQKPLSELSQRLHKILDLQIAVRNDTNSLHKAIQGTPDKKPRPEDKRTSLKLAVTQRDILDSVTRTITLLEKGDSGTAFAEVLKQVREDMKLVQSRLEKCEINDPTLALEADIVASVKEMIQALQNR